MIRFWVSEFDIDGIRLDAADVLDFDFMKALRHVADEVKPQFWLMGEVIHGDYTRWVNEGTLHSVTNYHLHKALYSGHNDHNYFEIAHTVKRLYGMGGNRPDGLKLYNFVDNHDVERIYTKLNNKAHFTPVHVLLYTLPGVPSIYYGSEFGIEGKKEKFSDASLRPALRYEDYANAVTDNPMTRLIAALGKVRRQTGALSYGDYRELTLTNRQYAFSRTAGEETVLVTVNNDENSASLTLPAGSHAAYVGALSGMRAAADNGNITVTLPGCFGEIWLPLGHGEETPAINDAAPGAETNASVYDAAPDAEADASVGDATPDAETDASVYDADPEAEADASVGGAASEAETNASSSDSAPTRAALEEAFEKGRIAGLQEAILAIMSKNGPVTDQMRRDVTDNVYPDSLLNWVKSFR